MLLFSLSALLESRAQTIVDDGNEQFIGYNGSYQDFVIPNNPLLVKVRVRLFGADGGAASVTVGQYIPFLGFEPIKTCRSGGGAGAFVSFIINVGSKPQEIPWGSTLRFIIGGKGVSGHVDKNVIPAGGTGYDYGGGGGGTALLYRESENHVWKLLGVAGGGGGAYQGMISGLCVVSEEGGAGRSVTSGGDYTGLILGLGLGGQDGLGGGPSGFSNAGGGGGIFSPGGSVSCIDPDQAELDDVGEGGQGYSMYGGGEVGGYGGNSEGCNSLINDWRNGGFGYGGGGAGVGAGGGGGGYSGGGAGSVASGAGGGGSYASPNNIIDFVNISSGGSTTNPDDGHVKYQVTLNQAPVAICKNVTIYLDASGKASITRLDIDNGSYDPDGTTPTFSFTKNKFTCADLGVNNITLTAEDEYGATATCTAVVTVVDNIIPSITCPANITVSCAANVPPVNTASVTATDNCPVTVTHVSDVITNQTCANRFTLTRTYKAADASGNFATCSQVITVFDNTAPVIINASTNITSLWPANHKMVDVIVNYNVSDNCATAATSLSVSSNEPINGTGDGDAAPDWEIVNNHLVKLRAERAGSGTGRIYTITITANDGCNNSSTKVVLVYVNQNNDVTATKTPGTQEVSKTKLKEMGMVEGIQVVATPNPTNNHFSIYIKSNNRQDKITMQVFDILGRRVELRSNVQTDAIIKIGDKYKQGAYFIRIMQGNEYKVIKLIKLSD